MARLRVDAIDVLIDDLSSLATLPDTVLEDILNAEADVIVQAQRAEIERQWKGPYSMRISAKSVKKDRKMKGLGDRGFYHFINIYPQGTRTRGEESIRNAEIAFINEYGAPSRGIAARPALGPATERKKREAVEAGEKVYHAYLDSKNL